MATSKLNIPQYEIKTFNLDCTTSRSGLYCGEKALTSEEIGNARIIIPLSARKAGTGFIVTVGVEGNSTIRLSSSVSQTGVTASVLFVY